MPRNPLIPKRDNSKVKLHDVPHSAGILDDHAVRKNIATKEGTIEKVPVNNSDIANKKYVDDENGTQDTAIGLNTTHRTGDGSDHADVATNTADIATNVTAIGLNTTHRGSDGSDHSIVTDNETAIAALAPLTQGVSDRGLMLYMPFENNAKDFSGQGNHGTVNGATFSADGKIGGCYSFDGGNDRIELGAFTDLDGATALTISCWIKPDNATFTGFEGIFARGLTATRVPWIYGRDGLDEVRFNMETTDSGTAEIIMDNIVQGVWQHIAFTWDGTNLLGYLNGVEIDDDTTSGNILKNTSGTDNYIGYLPGFDYFDGSIDEVKVWKNRALTADEVEAEAKNRHHAKPFGGDEYVNGTLSFGTYTGGAATDSTGYITVTDSGGTTRKLMVQA